MTTIRTLENIPDHFDEPPVAVLFEGQSWGWDGIDRRQTAGGGGYDEPSFRQGWSPIGKTYLEIFMNFFPMAWFSDVLLARTNVSIVNLAALPLQFGELLCFLDLRLIMATCLGWTVDDFWSYNASATSPTRMRPRQLSSTSFGRYAR